MSDKDGVQEAQELDNELQQLLVFLGQTFVGLSTCKAVEEYTCAHQLASLNFLKCISVADVKLENHLER